MTVEAEIKEIATWVRKRIDMRWQCANALPYNETPGNLVSQFSPHHLADESAMQATLLEHLLTNPDRAFVLHGVKIMAWTYRRAHDFNEKWLPETKKSDAS